MIFIHNLNPVAFEIFSIKIYWYSLAYIFGFFLGSFYAKRLVNRIQCTFKSQMIDDFLTYAIVSVIIGGRLGYVVFYNFNFFLNNPFEIIKIWNGGMSFHGGFLGVVLAMLIFSRIKKILFFDLANIVAACVPIGLFLGRIANFVNGELYGTPTNGEWGVIFNEDSIPRHPSQIYEAIFEGLLIFLVLKFFLTKKYFFVYNTCAIFLILYGSFRFIIEFFREPDSHIGYILELLSVGQILCLPMIFLGFYFLKRENDDTTRT